MALLFVGCLAGCLSGETDEETLELAREEIEELLQGTCLADAEIVPLSSTTGTGVEAFKQKLEALAMGVPPRSADGPFRMPVQRVFTLKGIGTVITGIPLSGSVAVGESVEILPQHKLSKVRAVQAYGDQVDRAIAGCDRALRDAGLEASAIDRVIMVGGSTRMPIVRRRVAERFAC